MKKVSVAISCFLIGSLFVLLVRNSCEIERYWFAPERPPDRVGWENVRRLDVVYLGEFVINKGESTDNGEVGVAVVTLPSSGTTCGTRSPRGCANRACTNSTSCSSWVTTQYG
jgi:hypothetical protein